MTIRKLEKEILAENGHVMILTTKSGDRANTHMNGGHENREVVFLDNSFPMPFSAAEIEYHFPYSLSSSTEKKIAEFSPSVIHLTSPDFTGLCLIAFARKHHIPLMGTYHSNLTDYMDHYPGCAWIKPLLIGFFQYFYGFLQALYVPTPFIVQHLHNTHNLDKYVDLQIWGRGIDLEKFSPKYRSEAFRQKLGIAPSEVVVLFVGRLVPEKRVDIFIKVVKRLNEEGVPYKALVVGNGGLQEKIEKLPNTICTGWMNGHDLSVVYASSDIFLFPSAVETFGNVTLEAAASGLPLVVEKNCSGHLVDHCENGYACENGGVDDFFKSTLSLILDEDKRKRFSEKSLAKSLSYELHTVGKQMISNYWKITDQLFDKYGGNHKSRDMEWGDKGFIGGTIARPLSFRLIEFYIMLIFRCFLAFYYSVAWLSKTFNKHSGKRASTDSQNEKTKISQANEKHTSKVTGKSRKLLAIEYLISVGDGPIAQQMSQYLLNTLMILLRITCAAEKFVRGL